jgi:serine/threonine-protein kinase
VVRELIEVEPLSSRLARQPRLPVDEAVHITLRMAEALAWIHRAGVAHGGIRPSNVFVRNRTVVVSDFGINQGLVADRPDLDASLELTGCAPEQLTGLRVGPASDVYAVGVLLYRMLAGVAPFVGQDPEETAKAQIGGRAVPLTSLDIEVPKEVAETCQLCLAKDPSTRPTWASLVIALASRESVPAAATDHIDSTSRPEPTRIEVHENPPRIMPGPRRLSLAARAAVAVAAALLLSGIVIAGVDRGRPTPGSSSRPVRPVARAPTSGIRVPDLIGLPASDARASLLHKGLRVARLVPVAGTPGLVARTWPAPDRAVVPGTPVILFIGVEGERLRQEFDRSPSPS